MDHLKTTEERQERWYCRTVLPRFVPVRVAQQRTDLFLVPPQDQNNINNTESEFVVSDSSEEDPWTRMKYDYVYSIPFEWLTECDSVHRPVQTAPELPSSTSSTSSSTLLRQVLDLHGFAVVSSVLTATECSDSVRLGGEWLEAARVAEHHVRTTTTTTATGSRSEIDAEQNDETLGSAAATEATTTEKGYHSPTHQTLSDANNNETQAPFPRTLEGGILPFYGSGHSTFAWSVRSHPAVQTVFGALYNDDADDADAPKKARHCGSNDLLSSLDGVILWTEQSLAQSSSDIGWFHIDQNPALKPGSEAVQGLVNLIPVSEETGGNALVVQSHIDFANGHYVSSSLKTAINNNLQNDDDVGDFYKQRLLEVGNDDWLEIDPLDKQLLHPNRVISILLGAGDILLWDSRVAHCSFPPQTSKSSTQSNDSRNNCSHNNFVRAATLVSMISAKSTKEPISDAVVLARKAAVDQSRTLTHWVQKASFLGHERTDVAALDERCVELIKAQQHARGHTRKLICTWEDLTVEQKNLVVGTMSFDEIDQSLICQTVKPMYQYVERALS